MDVIKKDDPVTLAKYAKESGLLNKIVWKWVKKYLVLKQNTLSRIPQNYAKKLMDLSTILE